MKRWWRVVMDVRTHQPDEPWMAMGPVGPGDRFGSVSHSTDGKRQALLFGWDAGTPGVWLSDEARIVADVRGLQQLADLRRGPFEMDVMTDSGAEMHVRWRLE